MTFIRGAKRKTEPTLPLSLSGKEPRAGQGGLEKGKVWSRHNPGRLAVKTKHMSLPPPTPPLTDMAERLSPCGTVNKCRFGEWLAGQPVFGHTHFMGKCVEPSSSSSSRPARLGPFLPSPLPGLPWSQLHGFKNRNPPDLQPRKAPHSTICLDQQA